MESTMKQLAPYPTILENLIERLHYKDGWVFSLKDLDRGQGSEGLTLVIILHCKDSYHPDRDLSVLHYMLVPPAAYDEHSWTRWLFDQIMLVEQHEACEFFIIDDLRPYAPHHGPGNNPYTIFEQGTAEEAQTTFRGEHFDLEKKDV